MLLVYRCGGLLLLIPRCCFIFIILQVPKLLQLNKLIPQTCASKLELEDLKKHNTVTKQVNPFFNLILSCITLIIVNVFTPEVIKAVDLDSILFLRHFATVLSPSIAAFGRALRYFASL